MVKFKAMILSVLGLLFVVACGQFEPLTPLKPEEAPGGGRELNLNDELVNQFSQKYLGDESGLLKTLGVEVGGPNGQNSFLEDLDTFPSNRYKIKGLTVEKAASQMPTQISTATASGLSVTIKVLIQVGEFYRALEFSGSFRADPQTGVVGGAFPRATEECFPNGCNEVSGISISEAGLAALSNADLAELIARNQMQSVADRFRPIAAYLSCGTDANCETATLLLQFVKSDENTGAMPEESAFINTLMDDVKAGFVVTGPMGAMSIAHSSVGPVADFESALQAAQGAVTSVAAELPPEISAEEQARIAAVESCVRAKIEAATVASTDVTTELTQSFQLECEADVDRSSLDEILAEALRVASAEVDGDRLQLCVDEGRSRAQREITEEEVAVLVNGCKEQILREDANAEASAVDAAVAEALATDPARGLPEEMATARQGLIDACVAARVSGSNTAQTTEITARCGREVDTRASERRDTYLSRLAALASGCVNQAAQNLSPGSPNLDPSALADALETCEATAVQSYKEIPREARVAELALLCAEDEVEAFFETRPATDFTEICSATAEAEVARFEGAFGVGR